MAEGRDSTYEETLRLVREARETLGDNGSFRTRVLLDMILIELEKVHEEKPGDQAV
jgi:hypothetical protein